ALAVELIQRLTSPEVQKTLALAGAIIPVDPTVLADPEVAQSPDVAGYVAALARGLPLPTYAYANAQWDIVANASELMWHRARTPEEALTAAQAALVAEVARIAGVVAEADAVDGSGHGDDQRRHGHADGLGHGASPLPRAERAGGPD
ncbi:MAG: hypothetical protein IT317_16785, partial [Anaerolineales bacterium]|nr:hypothetical protein [Anaerolineales bacterium]